jgi:hypothetical protein
VAVGQGVTSDLLPVDPRPGVLGLPQNPRRKSPDSPSETAEMEQMERGIAAADASFDT